MAAPAKFNIRKNVNPPPQQEHHVPQVANLVHRDVISQMDKPYAEFLIGTFGTVAFKMFCELQLNKVKDDLMRLSPRPEWSDSDYAQVSKDMRLVWRFWTDLLDYATDLTQQNRAQ